MKQRKNNSPDHGATFNYEALTRRRRVAESLSTLGLFFLALSLVVPFAQIGNGAFQGAFKWVFAAAALLYTGARLIPVNAPDDSLRLKRMRRLEVWAGILFCVASFFWFYKSARLGEFGFSLALIHDTILFTLAGAIIQIIASWMIAYRMKKEEKNRRASDSAADDTGD
ncbi:MAG: hypothetical protein HDS79_05950 [Bacteroidales bacterium]|nr:hypothetical protein [Bacteroidales bacterium]